MIDCSDETTYGSCCCFVWCVRLCGSPSQFLGWFDGDRGFGSLASAIPRLLQLQKCTQRRARSGDQLVPINTHSWQETVSTRCQEACQIMMGRPGSSGFVGRLATNTFAKSILHLSVRSVLSDGGNFDKSSCNKETGT